jgi:hypothetical protein
MTIGCFHIFGSLEYPHGATPSERTFLGVIPMFTSTNLIIQMRKTARLKKRLKTRSTSGARKTTPPRSRRLVRGDLGAALLSCQSRLISSR